MQNPRSDRRPRVSVRSATLAPAMAGLGPAPPSGSSPLPVVAHADAIVGMLRASGRLVLSAPTGSGKTTQVPQILLRAGAAAGLSDGRIIVLQPRRLATRVVATRVAKELGVALGSEVGYETRHEQAISPQTRLAFMTEGLFLRRMLGDPTLRGVSCVLLDEFHERSVDADLILGLVTTLQSHRRDDLRLAVMSATLDVERLREFLGVPPLMVSGRLFPVTVEHVRSPVSDRVWESAADATVALLRESDGGNVLIFMPGVHEIGRTISALRARIGAAALELLPLHGSLTPAQQDRAVAPGSQRKVIVATNVAETSLTIEGVSAVVDSGLARIHRHDPRRGINVLAVEPISQASAEQRAGRAGRLGPGRCIRLWTQADHRQRPERTAPEIRRLELAEPLLHLRAMGIDDARRFAWLDPPEPLALEQAESLLVRLGAVDAAGTLTADGARMAGFPVHPRIGRFLLAAATLGCLGRAVIWAALAGERDIVERSTPARLLAWRREGEPPSDLSVREALLAEAMRRNLDPSFMQQEGLSAAACREAARSVEQLRKSAARLGASLASGRAEDLIRAMLPSFPDHLAVRHDPQRPHCAMPGRKRVVLDEASVVRGAGPLLALELREIGKGDRSETALSLATQVEESLLREVFPGAYAVVVEDAWDARRSAVEQVERRILRLAEGELELGRTVRTGAGAGDAQGAATTMVERIVSGELLLERWDEKVEQWIRRVRLVAGRWPERGLIVYDDDDRRVILHEIVGDATRFSAIRDKPCLDAVKSALSWEDRRFVENMTPESIALPSGAALRLEYPAEGPPIGRARIQQLFGLSSSPTVCGGRQPVLMEILAPNQRPVQRTQDLANFWKTLYPELRKELKRRYPKHDWPEVPGAGGAR